MTTPAKDRGNLTEHQSKRQNAQAANLPIHHLCQRLEDEEGPKQRVHKLDKRFCAVVTSRL
jgi:hypothetical protein